MVTLFPFTSLFLQQKITTNCNHEHYGKEHLPYRQPQLKATGSHWQLREDLHPQRHREENI